MFSLSSMKVLILAVVILFLPIIMTDNKFEYMANVGKMKSHTVELMEQKAHGNLSLFSAWHETPRTTFVG